MALFREPKNPLVPGELRMKSWKTVQGLAPDDPVWEKRCKQYWELQERLFGFVASEFAMAVDSNEGFVSTYVTVLAVVDGERTKDYSLVPVETAGVERLMQ